MAAKILLAVIVFLLLFGLTMTAAADLLQPMPLLIRILGMLLSVVLFFYAVSKLVKFVLLGVVARVSRKVSAQLPANVRGELLSLEMAPLPYLDAGGGAQMQEEALKVKFRFAGVSGQVGIRLDPSSFRLLEAGTASGAGTSANFKHLFSGGPSGPSAFLEAMQGLQKEMSGETFKAEWIRVFDEQGIERLSASAYEDSERMSGLPLLTAESIIELYILRRWESDSTEFTLLYGMTPLFTMDTALAKSLSLRLQSLEKSLPDVH